MVYVRVWDTSNRDLYNELQWLFLFAVVLVKVQDTDRWKCSREASVAYILIFVFAAAFHSM